MKKLLTLAAVLLLTLAACGSSSYGEDTDDVYWEGHYGTDTMTMTLLIGDYDGKTFEFTIYNSKNDRETIGVATLDPKRPSAASGDGFSFKMNEDNTDVAVDGADGFAENFTRIPPGMRGETE